MLAFLATVIATVMVTLAVLAYNAFPRQPSVPTGQTVCGGNAFHERCGEEYRMLDVDIGNPVWVSWIQRHDWFTGLAIVLFLLAVYSWSKLPTGKQ